MNMRAFRGVSRGPPFLTGILFAYANSSPLSWWKLVEGRVPFLGPPLLYKVETKLLLHIHLILYSKKK